MAHVPALVMRRALLLGSGVLLLGVLLVLLRGSATPSAAEQQRVAALARWERRPFARYTMLLDDICELEVLVEDERVVDSTRVRCDQRGRTIDDLFALIARNDTISLRCVSRGCACDDMVSVQARYDERLGYPSVIDVRVYARPNWRNADYWRHFWRTWQPPRCDTMVEGSKTIRVLALTPLP